jgi:hypothetical protein
MDAEKLGVLREALDVYDVDRREELLDDHESEITRFLMRLGAYDAPYARHDGPEEEYRDWNGAVVGRGPSARLREPIPADPTLPAEELAPLAEWGRYARQLVIRHPAAPAALLKRIVPGADPQMLLDIALHKNADIDLFALLAHDERSDARWAPAASVRCPLAILELLAGDHDPRVRLKAQGNRSLPPRMQWLTDTLDVRRIFASHPLAPPEMAAQLAGDADALVRTLVAGNPATPASVLAALANDPVVGVREGVASNRITPASTLADLTTDPVTSVRIRVACNPHATVEIWTALGLDSDASVRAAVASSTAPPELKARLARQLRRR